MMGRWRGRAPPQSNSVIARLAETRAMEKYHAVRHRYARVDNNTNGLSSTRSSVPALSGAARPGNSPVRQPVTHSPHAARML
jgi:hypothetical protein